MDLPDPTPDELARARAEIVRMARTSRCRSIGTHPTDPARWRPYAVKTAEGESFTNESAWEFIADRAEAGHLLEPITLKRPAGKRGWVMKVRIGDELELHIKVRICRGLLIGRSFHYRDIPEED